MKYPDVRSNEEFFRFIEALIDDYGLAGESWENLTIPDFLEAMSAWVKDKSVSAPPDAWELMAKMLYAGSRYE